MRKLLLCSLLLCALSSYAQKGLFSIGPSTYFPKHSDPAIGIYGSGLFQAVPGLYAGFQIGVVKFTGTQGIYMPIQGKILALPRTNRLTPIITIEPGYGAYHYATRYSTTSGGFTLYGGAGVAFPSTSKGRVYITAGYSRFGFESNNLDYSIDCVGVQIGLLLK